MGVILFLPDVLFLQDSRCHGSRDSMRLTPCFIARPYLTLVPRSRKPGNLNLMRCLVLPFEEMMYVKLFIFISKNFLPVFTVYQQLSRLCDNLLRLIIKLSQNSVIFSVFDALFLRWMHFVFERGVIDKVAIVRAKYFGLLLMFIFCSHYHISTVFLSRRMSHCNCRRSLEIPLIHMPRTPHPSTR